MKRLLAMLLTGCMIFQPLQSLALTAYGGELFEDVGETAVTADDSVGWDALFSGAPVEGQENVSADTADSASAEVFSGEEPAQTLGEDAVSGEEQNPGTASPEDDILPEEDLFEEILLDEAPEEEFGEALPGENETEPETGEGVLTGSESETETESESESEDEFLAEETEIGEEDGIVRTALVEGAYNAKIQVEVTSALPFDISEGKTRNITVALSGGSFSAEPKTVVLSGKKPSETVEFEVPPDNYSVHITADKFDTYMQTIEDVQEYHVYKIKVFTDKVLTGKEGKYYGWIQLGDVNGDGDITKEDKNVILETLHANVSAPSKTASLDLNEDGVVDLADLQFVVTGLNTATTQVSGIERTTMPRNVEVQENTVASGDVKNLFIDNDEGVQLQPAKGGEISPDNPVEIGFDLVPKAPEGEQIAYEDVPQLEGMTIQPPAVATDGAGTEAVNSINAGTVTVECVNEQGKTELLTIPIGQKAKEVQMEELQQILGADENAETELPVEVAPVEETTETPAAVETETGETVPDETPAEELPMDGILVEGAPESAPVNGEASETEAVAQPQEILPEEPAQTLPMDEIILAALGDNANCKINSDGSIELNFGDKVAVKRVTIEITGTKKNTGLVDIAKVEFVNDMASRIPEPELGIPQFDTSKTIEDNEEFEVAWSKQENVTGYILKVSGETKKGGTQEQEIRVADTSYRVVAINDYPLQNYKTYTLTVRSVNGNWSSAESPQYVVTPRPKNAPDLVDDLKLTSGYRSLYATWKDMKDANGYMVYYRERGSAGEYQPVVPGYTKPQNGDDRLMSNSYNITGLKDNTEYEVYVLGWNDFNNGSWGDASKAKICTETTKSAELPRLPMYRAINGADPYVNVGTVPSTIISAVIGNHGGQKMVNSPLDEAKGAEKPTINGKVFNSTQWGLGLVDNNYESYWTKTDWDDGVEYPIGDFHKGFTITLDKQYKMNYLTFTASDMQYSMDRARIAFWSADEVANGVPAKGEDDSHRVGASVIRKTDDQDHPYYVVKFDRAVEAQMIHLYIGRGYGQYEMKVAEVRFHEYDPLDDEIYGLYTDDMHTELKADVDEEKLDDLEARLEAGDENGEKHPLYDSLKLELENARKLLTDQMKDNTVQVNVGITARKDGHLGFGGLNAWQPLGKSVAQGETLIVYVGHNVRTAGQSSDLSLVVTQYHAEASAMSWQSGKLKVGRNEITVPKVTNLDMERGGQLYVVYDGNNANDKYGIRVQGGVDIPVLNIYGLTGGEKTAAIANYVNELREYAANVERLHAEKHLGHDNVDKPYDAKNCVLNATDMMMERMMYSVPATQVWDAIKDKTDPAAQLEKSLDSMEKLMDLFYQHKGLNSAAGGRNAIPAQHLNIRYMRMFSGAFMYASGNHIGVEWPETMISAKASGIDSFGWGIAHEIGHNINQSSYAVAEITNNYFAQLMQKAANPAVSTRFTYENVYEKVTSGAIGRSPNQATQLALYWQLHLAFDDNPDSWTSPDFTTQLANLFFARVDRYARTPGEAPKPGLTLNGGVDQNLMRLSCAAANANILNFFRRWGMVPDAETEAYASQFTENGKALYYVNDEARDYRRNHPGENGNIEGQTVTGVNLSTSGNQVTVSIPAQAGGSAILGYEILRSMRSDGKESDHEVIGFVQAGTDSSATYVDTIASIDNRVMNYYVKAVDKFLNYSNEAAVGSAKVETGGALKKSSWTISTVNMSSPDDTAIKHNIDDPDAGEGDASGTVNSIERVIDNNRGVAYKGTITDTSNGGVITIDLGKAEELTSLQYEGSALASVDVEVSTAGVSWTKVKEGYTGCKGDLQNFHTIWFDSVKEDHKQSWVGTYDARFVRLTIRNTESVTINEINICGPSGDNVEFNKDASYGILSADYKYGKEEADVIKAGSLIFTGAYKGNPAFNVVMLFDREENVVGVTKEGTVKAGQVILADVPENGNLGTTSDGAWVYYVAKEDVPNLDLTKLSGKEIRAELYRVDDALTLEGERIVSDTQFIQLPTFTTVDSLPKITLTGKAGAAELS